MSEDINAIIAILILILSLPAAHFLGRDTGLTQGRNEAIIYCIEKPKECKTTYDYLKLPGNKK